MDKSPNPNTNHGGGFPPPSPTGRFTGFPTNYNVKSELGVPPPSSSLPPLAHHHGASDSSTSFSHDISRMPDNPPKKLGHRRAHSEIVTLPDDISFDSDLGVVGGAGGGGADGPSFSDEIDDDLFSMYLDMDKFNSSSATSSFQVGEGSAVNFPYPKLGEGVSASGSGEKPRIRHQHSQSMDGSTMKPDMLMSGSDEMMLADSKKAISAAKLSELALVDPKRAKRIWANRQSAARSKERKMRYIAELERKVQTLQTEATSLSAQLTLLQRDTTGLTAENSELKLRLQTMEQQVHLQDALNDALKEEIQHLKVMTGQQMPNSGPMMNYASSFGGGGHKFYSNNNNHHVNANANNNNNNTLLTAQQFQQLQIHSQKQQQQFQQHQMHHQQQEQASGDYKLMGSSSTQKDNSAAKD